MTATILLIRHASHVELGRTLSGRRRDVALSPDGLREAAILADLLGTRKLEAVYTSPRERAWYTARDIADPHGLKPVARDELDEVDFGQWSGQEFASLDTDPDWHRWNAERGTMRCPEGETMEEAVDRGMGAVEAIRREHEGATVAAVTHCDMIRGIVAHLLGLPLDHILRFDVDPASVTSIRVGPWGGQVGSINERLYQ